MRMRDVLVAALRCPAARAPTASESAGWRGATAPLPQELRGIRADVIRRTAKVAWPATAIALAALTLGGRAQASGECQPESGLSACVLADNWWPSPTGSFAWLGPSRTVESGSAAFAFATTYLHRPVGLSVSSASPEGTTVWAVEDTLRATLGAALGVTSRLQLEVALPFAVFQHGAGTSHTAGGDVPLPTSAIGDVRFGSSVSLANANFSTSSLSVAARLLVTAPTGDPDAFVSAPSVVFAPAATASYRRGAFEAAIDVGARVRRHAELGGALVGNQLSLGVGASFDVLRDAWLTLGAEAAALFTLEQQLVEVADPNALDPRELPANDLHIPAEWLVTARTSHFFERRMRLSVGVGGVLPTSLPTDVTAPAFRALATVAFTAPLADGQ